MFKTSQIYILEPLTRPNVPAYTVENMDVSALKEANWPILHVKYLKDLKKTSPTYMYHFRTSKTKFLGKSGFVSIWLMLSKFGNLPRLTAVSSQISLCFPKSAPKLYFVPNGLLPHFIFPQYFLWK